MGGESMFLAVASLAAAQLRYVIEHLEVPRRGRLPRKSPGPLNGDASQPAAPGRVRECPERIGVSARVLTRDDLAGALDQPLEHARANDGKTLGQSLKHHHRTR